VPSVACFSELSILAFIHSITHIVILIFLVNKVQIYKAFNNEQESKLLHFKVNFVNNYYMVLTLEIYAIAKMFIHKANRNTIVHKYKIVQINGGHDYHITTIKGFQ
jgi:hypothetical protein